MPCSLPSEKVSGSPVAGAERNSERLNEAKYVSVAQLSLDLNILKCGVENSGENVMPK